MPNPTRARAAQPGLCERCEQPIWRRHAKSRGPLPAVHDECLTAQELARVIRRRETKRRQAERDRAFLAPQRQRQHDAEQRRAQMVASLRTTGWSIRAIAHELRISPSKVHRLTQTGRTLAPPRRATA